jgi:DNA-binding LytR/AlgR family response regulator
MMNCLVIDDEPLARQGMEILIKTMPNITLLGQFSNPLDAIEILSSKKVDLLFLDINMPEMSGLEFLKTLKNSPMIIFTTAYPQYAIESYELDAIDYLLKPIRIERFVKAINKAQNYAELLGLNDIKKSEIESVSTDFVFVKADRKHFKVYFKEILFIEGLKDYVIIHTASQKIITAMNLKTVFELLPENQFLRINKSNIVNTEYITSFDTYSVYLTDLEISIGNSYKEDFTNIYLRK